MKLYNHFINGKWIEPIKNEYFDTENPFTGEVWAKVARGCEKDADLAVKAAKAAFDSGTWADMRPCLLYTSPSPRDAESSRMPSSA